MRNPFDDEPLPLSALGRSEDPIGPYLERGGLDATTAVIFDRIVSRFARERRYRWPLQGRRRLIRTAATFGWLALVLTAAALLIIGSWN